MSPWWGAAVGVLFACGLLLISAGAPFNRRVQLDQRIEPYLDQAPRRTRLLGIDPRRTWRLSDLTEPLTRRAGARLDRLLGGRESVQSRQVRAGLHEDVEGFRVQQALWGLSTAALMTAMGSVLWWVRGASVLALSVLIVCAFLVGVVVRDMLLTRAAVAREAVIMTEFPTLAELLALSVTAGEGTVQALERVARLSRGELSAELNRCLAHARTGASLPEALQGLSQRTGLPPIIRFADGLVVAIQRGTPLGEVLRSQAADAREAARQSLIEQGGKREISMMIPVVFLVLPITVLFAIFPGMSMFHITL